MEDGQFIVTSLRLRSAAARAGVSVGDRVAAYKHASHRDEDASDEESNTSLTRWSRSSLDCINAFPVEQGVVLHVSTARRQRTKDSSKPKTTRRPVRCKSLVNSSVHTTNFLRLPKWTGFCEPNAFA